VPKRGEGEDLAAVSIIEDSQQWWRRGGIGRGVELWAHRGAGHWARRRALDAEERGVRQGIDLWAQKSAAMMTVMAMVVL
jgi:hypothetical protein